MRYILAEGPPRSLRYPLKSGSWPNLAYLLQDAFLAAADDEFALMCRDRTKGASAKASAMDVDRELNHVVGRDAFVLIFGVPASGCKAGRTNGLTPFRSWADRGH